MSSKYEPLAHDIVRLVGGKENVSQAYHCVTRLRFILADEGKADEDAINALFAATDRDHALQGAKTGVLKIRIVLRKDHDNTGNIW